MGWVWAKGRENHKNVWRKVPRRLMDITQQEIMKVCKEMKSLTLQREIKGSWGKEPYLHVLDLQERSGLAWARLGVWRALKLTDDSGVRVCPMCGNFEVEFHILGGLRKFRKLEDSDVARIVFKFGKG